MSDSSNEQRYEQEALLIHYWYILQKRKLTVLLFTGMLVVTVILGTLALTPYYAAMATIEINPSAPVVFDVEEVTEMGSDRKSPLDIRAYYATQYRIIKSHGVLSKTLDRLRADHGVTDFDSHPKPARFFGSHLIVRPDAETWLVDLTFEYPDPDKAALYVNTLAEVYIEENLASSLDASEQALEWLRRQHDEYRSKKISSDQEVLEYKSDNDLMGIQEARNTSLVALGELQEAWGKAHTEQVESAAVYQELSRLIQAEDWLGLTHYVSGETPVLQQLLGDYQRQISSRNEMLARYKAAHPKVQQVDQSIALLSEQLRSQVQAYIQGRQAALRVITQRELALSMELKRIEKEVKDLEGRLMNLDLLQSEADRNEQFYTQLDVRMSEVDLSQLIRANNIRVVDLALPSTEIVRPKMGVNVLMGLVLGIFGGCALAFFMEYLDSTVKSREDVETVVGLPFIGVVPVVTPEELRELPLERDRNIFVHARPRSAVAESLRSIRTNLFFRVGQKPLRRLLITSAVPREGKSFISSNLSTLIAMTGSRVLLVDVDLRRPNLHKLFKMENTVGLSNALTGERPLEEVIQKSHVPGLDIITSGPTPPNPAELLGNDSMEQYMTQLSDYDLIVLDSPPVSVVADPLMLTSLVEGVLVVIEANRTSRALVQNTRARLEEVNANMLGAVVNKLNAQNMGYGYYYYYDAYHDYSYEPREQSAS